MGTRADFYVGRGTQAEWLGSIAWDGYPSGIPESIMQARNESAFRQAVESFLSDREDATRPVDGWPWPWNDSATTDYAYAFDAVRVYGSCFGSAWFPADIPQPEENSGPSAVFPDMSSHKRVAFGNRSGTIIVSAP